MGQPVNRGGVVVSVSEHYSNLLMSAGLVQGGYIHPFLVW